MARKKKVNSPNTDTPKKKIIGPKQRIFIGCLFILVAVYALVAIVSYFFTWKHDQSIVMQRSLFELFQLDAMVENKLGKFGAYISHFLLYRTFGISGILFTPYLIYLGLKTLKVKNLPKNTSLLPHLLWIVSILPVIVYLLFPSPGFLGGTIGKSIGTEMQQFLGNFGATIFILFLGGFYCFLFFSTFFVGLFNKIKSYFFYLKKGSEAERELDLDKPVEKESKEESLSFEDQLKNAELEDDDDDDEIILPGNEETSSEIELNEQTSIKEEKQEQHLDIDEMEVTVVQDEEDSTEQEESEENITIEVGESDELDVSDRKWNKLVEQSGEYDPTQDLSEYKFPTVSLLAEHGEGSTKPEFDEEELIANKNRIKETLGHYKIGVDKVKVTVGPTVTLYEIVPEAGVRISKIKNLEDDIALSLAALGIRIIAPIPGKGTIGIEVPSSKPATVSMKSLLKSEKFTNSKMDLPVALGKSISNEIFIADLAKMPHLLMAGATGQGKSVGLNAILVSLLYKKHPSQLKFVLVDPKKVELTLYNKIERHYLAKLPDEENAIITDTQKVIKTLNSLCVEMDERYDLLQNAQVRNIKEYNQKFKQRRLNPEKGHRFLPYIVLVVDEFADLIMTAGKEVEQPIARLAQLARAIGIHLIIATQRPSVNIITGIIKANFPARIAFRVTAKVDSRTILDAGGADQLIGRGDLLYSTGSDLTRLQCGFVDTPEVEEICEFIGNQRAYPSAFMLPEVEEEGGDGTSIADDEPRDKLFEDAAHIVINHQQGSASLLQRKLSIGYNRAGRIVDQLEAAGIIGGFEGSKARKVNFPDTLSLEQFLKNDKEIRGES